jgi:hypothetical protein
VFALVAAHPPSAAAQQPIPAPPQVIDGPTSAIVRPSGLGIAVARDGTGAVVYLKQVAGATHVFVSVLSGGSFQPPVQVDTSQGGASSQPVVAAGNGGLLIIGFINGGNLYVAGRGTSAAPFTAPASLAGGASNPSISMSNFGKAYLAFTAAHGGGHDVRAAYYNNGSWALEGAPLNATPADDAGTGAGAPDVATAGDGVAIVVWGEGGHVYSRRVWATSPSVAIEQADGAPVGCTEGSASHPAVGTEGDSSWADVAFQEVANCGGPQQTRVLVNRLQASAYNGVRAADGLSGTTSDSAISPQVTMGEYGHGWVTSVRTTTHDVFANELWDSGGPLGITQINSLPNATTPVALPATAGLYSNLIAWQQNPGSAGPAEIRTRYAPQGDLGPELVLSSPAQGPTDAADGFAAGGDVAGDAAVAWLQGPPSSTSVVVDQLYQAPGAFSASSRFRYSRTSQPTLSWSPAKAPWGPITYSVLLDGASIGQTSRTSLQVPAPIADGRHSWQVTASNPAGQQSRDRAATIFVDTMRPAATVKLHGHKQAGSRLELVVSYADHPPVGQPGAAASGIAKVLIRWGDRSATKLLRGHHRSFHVYKRPGRYKATVTVTDKAGNATRVVMVIKLSKPKGG